MTTATDKCCVPKTYRVQRGDSRLRLFQRRLELTATPHDAVSTCAGPSQDLLCAVLVAVRHGLLSRTLGFGLDASLLLHVQTAYQLVIEERDHPGM